MTCKVLVLSGYGLNCEQETLHAFELVGATGDIVHINDLIAKDKKLDDYQILAIPGGFSYGDDTGSGNAYASRLHHNLWEELREFMAKDKLALGICNGCQILVNLGLVPGEDASPVALTHNTTARYQCRWVHVKSAGNSLWLENIENLYLPVAHGEGNFVVQDTQTLQKNQQISMQYVTSKGETANGVFPANPNGSVADIAALSDKTGRVLAMMPHPERAIHFTQQPDWPLQKEKYRRSGKPLPTHMPALDIFRNGVAYFK